MTTHHPSELTLTAFAAGTLSEGASHVVAAHVVGCPHCREVTAMAEATGGALLDDMPPTEMAADALELALARIDRPAPHGTSAGLVFGRRRWLAPGVWITPGKIAARGREQLYRLDVPQGRRLPRHSHEGREFVAVLQGCFVDESGLYAVGDFGEADASDDHQPTVQGDTPCVCLIWTEGPLHMRDPIGRLLQPWLGI